RAWTYDDPNRQPGAGRAGSQFAHPGCHEHGVVFGSVGGTAGAAGRQEAVTGERIVSNIRQLGLLWLLAVAAFGQDGHLGAFSNSGDVGNPARKGSTEFNASNGQYRVTGAGANIWAKEDQFQYVWREMSGNFAVTATMQFLGTGEGHRKAGIMLRQSLD